MFGALGHMFSSVKVDEKDGIITVRNLRADFIESDIKKLFASNKVVSNMFIEMGRYKFSFPSYFAPDFLFTLERLTEQRSLKIPVHTLSMIKEQLKTNTWLKNVDKPLQSKLDKRKLDDFIFTPLDFQSEFFDIYDRNTQVYNLTGFLFAAAAGAGKSYSALALTHCLNSKTVIVVAPKNAVTKVWDDSVKKLFKTPQTYWTVEQNKPFTGTERFLIINYEYLGKFLSQIDKVDTEDLSIILDESHNLGEVKTNRTQLFVSLCEQTKCNNVIWLSGTPVKASSMEAIPLLRCVDPLFTPDVEIRFKAIFKGDSNKATIILQNRLGLVSFKVAKARLSLDPPIFKNFSISFKEASKYTLESIKEQMLEFIKERKEYYASREKDDKSYFYSILDKHERQLTQKFDLQMYKLYRSDLIKVIKSAGAFETKDEMMSCNKYELREIMPRLSSEDKVKFKDVKTIVKYVNLKITGEALGRIIGRARINCHVDMTKHIDFKTICESTQKKTVVFSTFTEVIKAAATNIKEIGMHPTLVYADTNKDLPKIITQFETDPAINPIIATYASLSTAVPLVMADTVLLIDTPFRDYVLQQAISRIHRLGATTQTYVYTCVLETEGKPNISTRTLDILKWSQDEINAILGIQSAYILTSENTDTDLNVSIEQFKQEIEGYDNLAIESFNEIKPNYLSW